jgi:MYXO-CTERM domain-containing protein
MKSILAGTVAVAIAALAGSANAAFFSFASDNDSSSWTFSGMAATVGDAEDARDPQVLLIDDDNGILPTIAIAVEFEADFTIAYRGSVALAGGFAHNYDLSGSFAFLSGNVPLISASIINGSFTAQGPTQASWGTTAGIQGNDQAGTVVYSFSQAFFDMLEDMDVNPADYGISRVSQSDGIDDAAFTLTVLNRGDGFANRGVDLNPQTMLPLSEWRSEGSYSGSAVVPTPGAIALLGLGGLVAIRRRR